FRGDAKFGTYLLAIARFELLKFFERKGRTKSFDLLTSSLADLTPTPASLAGHRDERALLVHALRHIPVDMQIAIELHYFQGMRGPELASVLAIPEGTVRSRLRRGIEELRDQLARLAGKTRREWESDESLESWARSLDPYRAAADP